MTTRLVTLLLAVASLAAVAAEPGDTLPAFELETAGGEERVLDASIRRIYATGDRKSDELLETAMRELDQSVLDAQGAIVIADISGAPFFVKGMIKSSLEERAYSTWVDTRKKTRAHVPYRSDRVAVIDLDARRIVAIRHHGDSEALRRELLPAATPSPTPTPTATPADERLPPEK